MNMTAKKTLLISRQFLNIFCVLLPGLLSCFLQPVSAQDTLSTAQPPIVDVVWLRDGSKLSGTIIKWDIAKGMEFKLLTGAQVIIPKSEIHRVYQDVIMSTQQVQSTTPQVHQSKLYNFKEEGFYQTFSVFLNTSTLGGAGMHYSAGHRFKRTLGVGLGIGFESNDLTEVRNSIPLYAEARGFFLKSKITPYYGLKIGYGFALENEDNFVTDAKGGFHFSPEFGVRFGANAVSYY